MVKSIGRGNKFAKKRIALRDELWGAVAQEIWTRLNQKGFATIPRTLPLILVLIKQLTKNGDASKVYLDLWSRVYDEGFVDIKNEEDCAYAAGYTGSRARRTWRDHLNELERLGFVKTKESGNREVAFVLILNPHKVARTLLKKKRVPSEWWNAFVSRSSEIGAEIPD